MTEEAPKTPEQLKAEAAAKAQEVGKKLTGFLGGLAEKAKNIDMKDLTEKAKQKVNEVKDKANELNAGKAEKSIPARETISADEMKSLIIGAAQTPDEIPNVVRAVLADVTQGEQTVLKMKFGTAADPAYVALSAKAFYHFAKASDQFVVSVYPAADICAFSLLPPRGDMAGRFVVMTRAGEVKLTVASLETYGKTLILYKKLRELVEK